MWELDYKESWVPKNRYFWTEVLEKTLESPLDCKEIQTVHPKGNQSWIFIVRTDVEAEMPILWPPNAKSWLIWKDPDAGKDWRWEEKGSTEDEVVGWHHRLMDMSVSKLRVLVMDRVAWCASVHGVKRSWTRLIDWTEPILSQRQAASPSLSNTLPSLTAQQLAILSKACPRVTPGETGMPSSCLPAPKSKVTPLPSTTPNPSTTPCYLSTFLSLPY